MASTATGTQMASLPGNQYPGRLSVSSMPPDTSTGATLSQESQAEGQVTQPDAAQNRTTQAAATPPENCTEPGRRSHSALYHLCRRTYSRALKGLTATLACVSTVVLALLLAPLFCGIPTLSAVVFLPVDLILGLARAIKHAQTQPGRFRTVAELACCLVVIVVWPGEVLLCHIGMILRMAMVSTWKGDPVGLAKLSGQRTVRFLQLAICSVTGLFEQKWKVMECHSACAVATLWHFLIVGMGMVLIAAIRFVHCMAAGVRQACDVMGDWHGVLRSFIDARGEEEVPTIVAVLLWLVTLPFVLPVAILYACFLCTIIGLQLALGGTLAFVCTLFGGAFYVADTCYKFMTLDSTTGAMYVNVQAFDDFTTRLMRPFVTALTVPDDLEYPILEELAEPNPFFLNEFMQPDANGNRRPVQLPYLLNVATMFLSECRELTRRLLDDHWLTMNDLASAEPFLFIGLPGITLLHILQRSKKLDPRGMYDGYLYFIPKNEVDASLLLVSGAWAEVKGALLDAHALLHQEQLTPEEQTYLEAWIALVGDEERLPVLATPIVQPSPARKAHLLKISSALQTVAIAVSRMAWFQQQFLAMVSKQLLRMSAVQSSEPSLNVSATATTNAATVPDEASVATDSFTRVQAVQEIVPLPYLPPAQTPLPAPHFNPPVAQPRVPPEPTPANPPQPPPAAQPRAPPSPTPSTPPQPPPAAHSRAPPAPTPATPPQPPPAAHSRAMLTPPTAPQAPAAHAHTPMPVDASSILCMLPKSATLSSLAAAAGAMGGVQAVAGTSA